MTDLREQARIDLERHMAGQHSRWVIAHAVRLLDELDRLTAQNAALMAERDVAQQSLNRYRAAVSWIASDSWDGCSDCIEQLKIARCADASVDPLTCDELSALLATSKRDALAFVDNTAFNRGLEEAAKVAEQYRDAWGEGNNPIYDLVFKDIRALKSDSKEKIDD